MNGVSSGVAISYLLENFDPSIMLILIIQKEKKKKKDYKRDLSIKLFFLLLSVELFIHGYKTRSYALLMI